MFRLIIVMICVALTVSACGSTVRSKKVKAMQRKDKLLTCKEILLEMNEAEFYRSTAERNKGPSVKSILMPLGYISTYMDAEEAIKAAAARVDYLDRIYQIMDCDVKDNQGGSSIFPAFGGNSTVAKPTPGALGTSPQATTLQRTTQQPAVIPQQVVPTQPTTSGTGYSPMVQPR